MKLASLLIISALMVALTFSLPVTRAPEVVQQSEEGIRFLWARVQGGTLPKSLPAEYRSTEAAWDYYLDRHTGIVLRHFYG